MFISGGIARIVPLRAAALTGLMLLLPPPPPPDFCVARAD